MKEKVWHSAERCNSLRDKQIFSQCVQEINIFNSWKSRLMVRDVYPVAISKSLTWPSCNGLKEPDRIIFLCASDMSAKFLYQHMYWIFGFWKWLSWLHLHIPLENGYILKHIAPVRSCSSSSSSSNCLSYSSGTSDSVKSGTKVPGTLLAFAIAWTKWQKLI